jgi:DNA-binding response OmpR family regulator
MDRKKILVVDDENDILLMLDKRLTAEGYSVITATNGVDAVALAKTKNPDLVILDIIMPDIEGGQVAEWLKSHFETRNIPVIFLTGLVSKTEEGRYGPTIGGNVIFAKPFEAKELLAQIKRILSIKETVDGTREKELMQK